MNTELVSSLCFKAIQFHCDFWNKILFSVFDIYLDVISDLSQKSAVSLQHFRSCQFIFDSVSVDIDKGFKTVMCFGNQACSHLIRYFEFLMHQTDHFVFILYIFFPMGYQWEHIAYVTIKQHGTITWVFDLFYKIYCVYLLVCLFYHLFVYSKNR